MTWHVFNGCFDGICIFPLGAPQQPFLNFVMSHVPEQVFITRHALPPSATAANEMKIFFMACKSFPTQEGNAEGAPAAAPSVTQPIANQAYQAASRQAQGR